MSEITVGTEVSFKVPEQWVSRGAVQSGDPTGKVVKVFKNGKLRIKSYDLRGVYTPWKFQHRFPNEVTVL